MAIWSEFIKIAELVTKLEQILELVSKLIWKICMFL